ncbi:hypothetical protein GCM10009665_66420 [Kitasatospora nipponensis]|uniref:PBP domain-containing protein n=1 Tax=Kitasatospora nipponensis TaxID=258049 RepID=A0ABP4HJ20_9ACTN
MRVRDRGPRGLGWWSRAWLSATAAWAVVAVLAVLPLGAGTVQKAHADTGSITVQGPPVWIPDPATGGTTGTTGPDGSITVSPATNLANQVVHVSWKGFTPSVTPDGHPATSATAGSSNTLYPVRVYQCRGVNPGPTDCYGGTVYGGDAAAGFAQTSPSAGTAPEFPSNMVLATTGADGSGSADIEVWTAIQSQTLKCGPTQQCSLAIVPNYGGDSLGLMSALNGDTSGALSCKDHTADNDGYWYMASDHVTQGQNLSTGFATGESCSWDQRTVVPLTFAPTPDSCEAAANDFSMAGLPMGQRAVQQWRAGACLASSPQHVGYTAQGEPLARQAFLGGSGAELALTSRADTGPAPRPYVYVPLANSAISVVFSVDDPTTGRPIPQMRLNARLLAKELTQSYTHSPVASEPSVEGNPMCLFQDPEFLELNPPSLIAPAQWPTCVPNLPVSLPIVLGSSSDMVHQLTAWIAADPDAAAFLQGQPDPWGMHVDTFYQRPAFSGYPVDLFIPQDASGVPGMVLSDGTPARQKQYEWSPVLGGLDDAVRDFLKNTPTCTDWNLSSGNVHVKCQAQVPGSRQLIGIMDSADAAAYSLPQAAIVNQQGSYLTPTTRSIQAAVNDMALDPATGTQQLPYGRNDSGYGRDAGAYPLTMVQYAMAPTTGLGDTKTAAVTKFLQQVTDPGGGQLYGREPGRLGLGYADLTSAQQGLAQAAIADVANQDGALPGNQKPPVTATPTPSPTGTPSTPEASPKVAVIVVGVPLPGSTQTNTVVVTAPPAARCRRPAAPAPTAARTPSPTRSPARPPRPPPPPRPSPPPPRPPSPRRPRRRVRPRWPRSRPVRPRRTVPARPGCCCRWC